MMANRNPHFDGILKIDLDIDEAGRIIYDMPFRVTELMGNYSGKAQRKSFKGT